MNGINATGPQLSLPTCRGVTARRAIGLALLLLVLRIPLLDHPTPVTIDETYFLQGLGFPADYPVHHPGYPLWIALGTVLRQFGCEPYRSFQLWSLLASLIAPLLLYRGLKWTLDDGPAWWLALAFGVNPLVWFQSVTALTYLSAGGLGLLVVGLCHRAIVEDRRPSLYAAAAALSGAIFLRADLLIYLGPMIAYAAWHHRRRAGWLAIVIIAAAGAALFALTAHLYGRADATRVRPDLSHTLDILLGTSVFRLGLVDGLVRNTVKIVLNLGWDFGAAIVLLPWAIWYCGRDGDAQPGRRAILLLWVLPLTVFLLLMHVVQGYFTLLLPAGYGVIGLALRKRCRAETATRLAAVMALCSILQFTLYPWSAESRGFKRLLDATIAFQSAAGLRHIDRLPELRESTEFWPTAAH